jgi:hypothetical protein
MDKVLAQIQTDQLERLYLDGTDLGEKRLGELVKELKGNKSVKYKGRSWENAQIYFGMLCLQDDWSSSLEAKRARILD